MYIYPYKMGSESAKALAQRLNIMQIKKENSRFKGKKEKLVINWGNSTLSEEVSKCTVINSPEAVALCANKLEFFKKIEQYNESDAVLDGDSYPLFVPTWSTDFDWAVATVASGSPVLCRTVVNGHSGEGIVIASTPEEVVESPLYVKYIPKKTEYRVHVAGGKVIDVQRKARDPSVPIENVNWKIRNHQFGFIFVRDMDHESIPKKVLTQSVTAVKVVGLDFGAVDIIWNEKHQKAYVLEVNTAPGLQGTTLDNYSNVLSEVALKFDEIINKKEPAPYMAEFIAQVLNNLNVR